MPSIEWTGLRSLSIIKSMMVSIWRLNKLAPELDQPNICQAIVLLSPRIHGVRHRFLNKIRSILLIA